MVHERAGDVCGGCVEGLATAVEGVRGERRGGEEGWGGEDIVGCEESSNDVELGESEAG